MYELIQVGEKTFYINSPSKIGLYKLSDKEVVLIDSGNDKDAGRKIQRIIEENGWEIKMILNTHSNADHIGGNNILQQRLGIPAYSSKAERAFIENPILEPSFLFGGYPVKELRNKFLCAQESKVSELKKEILPDGLEIISLEGHFFSMTGFKTSDDIWFLADCVADVPILEKYHIFFIYDVQGFLDSLDKVDKLEGQLFIPSHAEPVEDIRDLTKANREKVYEIIALVKDIAFDAKCFEEILKEVFDHYSLKMDFNQYVLVGSTIRSYLAYLKDKGEITAEFIENKLLWRTN